MGGPCKLIVLLPSPSSPFCTAPYISQCLQASWMYLYLSQQVGPSTQGWPTKVIPSWPPGPLSSQDRGEISSVGSGKSSGWGLDREWGQRSFLDPRGVIKGSPCIVLEPDRLGVKPCICLCNLINTMGFKIPISANGKLLYNTGSSTQCSVTTRGTG